MSSADSDKASSAGASSSHNSSNSSAARSGPPAPIDPILRNALRYTLSAKEYELLHQYLLSRAPAVKKRTLHPKRYDAITKGPDDYNVAAVRDSLRLGVGTFVGLKIWDLITSKMKKERRQPKLPVWKSPNVRLSTSLAMILLFHRLLRRFFVRIRESLLSSEARSFRRRNPRISRSLTSRLAPAIGSSLAGFFLAVYPGDQLRVTIAIYIFTRALEFAYNYLEDQGYFKNRPGWFGSWMLMPVACGQLLHAFVFDRDCFPAGMGDYIMSNSPAYLQPRPADYPSHLSWPGTYTIADSLAAISRASWPPFTSPILFPTNPSTLPKRLAAISPITSPAHPAIKHLSCALLHPHDPSCLRTYISYWIQSFPKIARFFTLLFTLLSVTQYKSFVDAPSKALNALAKRILRMSFFLAGAIGSSWGSICLFSNILPRHFLSTQRWFFGGFIGGLWAYLERRGGRGNFLYCARMSLDSAWKVGVKRGWVRGVKNGDVLLAVCSLALVNCLYEIHPKSISSGVMRKGLGVARGEGWVDRAKVKEREEKKKE